MKSPFHLFPIILALLLILTSLAQAATPITITRVVDGDTVAARIDGQGQEIRIRLYGIDAPEKRQAYGQQATQALQSLTSGRKAEMEAMDKDRYGRTVAMIRTDKGKDVNGEMVASGMAWVYPRYCRASVCGRWEMLERSARAAKFGLWRDKNPIAPWEWRRK
ncbi:MAG: thermonuclease family protein [Desulfobulbus sp.]|nr:thermonuclease family protein [Desulfobulbus sp.]